ncbi:hypothetical protein [Rhizobium hainanense]|uniref:hypothetical protein n=1 Tax=Rhizobium hainanense TaxID=52131 RepID=UPI00117A4006|nr:hypothetical protein [Rhizobium hainanense]
MIAATSLTTSLICNARNIGQLSLSNKYNALIRANLIIRLLRHQLIMEEEMHPTECNLAEDIYAATSEIGNTSDDDMAAIFVRAAVEIGRLFELVNAHDEIGTKK